MEGRKIVNIRCHDVNDEDRLQISNEFWKMLTWPEKKIHICNSIVRVNGTELSVEAVLFVKMKIMSSMYHYLMFYFSYRVPVIV